MPGIPEVLSILNQIKLIHEKKNQDYAADGKPFENFERSAEIASWFHKHPDVTYAVLIGTKLARLATLLNSDKEPNNEPIDDSFLDLATYCILWGAHHRRERNQKGAKNPSHPVCPSCLNSFAHSGYRTNRGEFCSSYCLGQWNEANNHEAVIIPSPAS